MRYLILLVFFVNTNLFSQGESSIVYGAKLNLTIEEVNELNNKNKQAKVDDKVTLALKSMIRNSTEVEGVLVFSKLKSNYELFDALETRVKLEVSLLKNMAGGNKIYFTSLFPQKNQKEDCNTLGECYVIENEKPIWELTQQTKIIGSYLCYKAIQTNSNKKNKKTIAWYTNEIPLGFGPVNYYGLPGMILEVDSFPILFKAKKIILNSKKKIKVREPKGKEVTKKEFKSLLRKAFPDFYNYKK